MKSKSKFSFDNLSINIRILIAGLLLMDMVVLGVFLLRHNTSQDEPVKTAEPTASVSAETDRPEPTAEPEPTAQPLLNIQYVSQPFTAENTEEGFASEWSLQANDPAYGDTFNTFDTATVNISSGGNSLTDLYLSRGGIPFQAGVTYTVFFNVSSTVHRKIGVTVLDWNSGTVFNSTTFDAGENSSYYEWSFKPTTTYNGGIRFELGNNGVNDYHTVVISGIRIAGDDSNAAVRTNQIGYYTTQQKRCTFIYSAGDLFDVVNKDTGAIAYSGAIVGRTENSDTGETDYYGDFTNLREPGTYFIRSQTGVVSHAFTISDDPYADLRKAALRMLSYQRCGQDLGEWAGAVAHPACHNTQSNFYMTETYLDTTGGWHDAGDYGRYVKTGAKAVNDLLLSYLCAPSLFGDDNSGPDSGNGIPDILDEARYELDWMMKMQDDAGALYVKASTISFPDDYQAPETDSGQMYILAADTISTSDAAGSFAIAAIVFKDIDSDYADRCLQAAKKAESYLNGHSDMTSTINPTEFSTGQYLDDSDLDARFTAHLALYAATKDTQYLEKAKQIYYDNDGVVNTTTWKNNGMYGAYLFLITPGAQEEDSEFYEKMREEIETAGNELVNAANITPYHVANGIYAWGSNSTIANNGVVLSMAYDITGNQVFAQTALEQINYLLGKNSLDMSFVSGYGFNYPKNQHNRLTLSKNTSLPGFLSGGPDASREDDITEQLPADTPYAKMYVDDYRSYSTNEVAIYYNSALLFLLAAVS